MKMKRQFLDAAYHPGRDTLRFRRRTLPLVCLICGALLFGLALSAASALAQEETKAEPKPQSGENLSEVGAKLANPLGELWALNFNFETPKIFDGDVNTGNPRFGADVIFQPVLPIPL